MEVPQSITATCIRQTVMLLEMLNDGRTKPVIPDQGISAAENQAVILGDRLEHVVQFMRSRQCLSREKFVLFVQNKIPCNRRREF